MFVTVRQHQPIQISMNYVLSLVYYTYPEILDKGYNDSFTACMQWKRICCYISYLVAGVWHCQTTQAHSNINELCAQCCLLNLPRNIRLGLERQFHRMHAMKKYLLLYFLPCCSKLVCLSLSDNTSPFTIKVLWVLCSVVNLPRNIRLGLEWQFQLLSVMNK